MSRNRVEDFGPHQDARQLFDHVTLMGDYDTPHPTRSSQAQETGSSYGTPARCDQDLLTDEDIEQLLRIN